MSRLLRTAAAVLLLGLALIAALGSTVPADAAAAGTSARDRGAAREKAQLKTCLLRASKRSTAAARRRARTACKRRAATKRPDPATASTAPGAGPATGAQSQTSTGAPAPVSSTGAAARTSSPRLFAPTSFWNTELPANAPIDPRSNQLVTALAAEVQSETVANSGPWINFDAYSVPVYTVGRDVPTVRVQLDADVPALQRDFDAVPIPAGAREAAGSDRHMTVYQPSTDTLWEFWVMRREADGWHAAWGGKMTNVSTNPGYFDAPYGATATSLPLIGGLMTIAELKAGRIDHALALAVPNTDSGSVTWPAQRGDGRVTGAGAIPEGTRFRIDPAVDLNRLGLSPLALVMARAAQRYGIVVRDTAGVTVFYGEDPVATPGDPYGAIFGGDYPNRLLAGFPWEALQVVAPPAGGARRAAPAGAGARRRGARSSPGPTP
jgi:hypothetical protein